MLNRCQVVGDQDVGDPPLVLDIFQQIQYLGPDGNVQVRYRLVENDKGRFQRQRSGDADALPLPAAKFVGELGFAGFGQAHGPKSILHPSVSFTFTVTVDLQGFPDDVAHTHPGIQCPVRVLQDRLN